MTANALALGQARALSRRSIVGTFRQPQLWLPGMFFPLLMAAVYTSQFARAVELPGFPEVDSFLDFLLPASVLQGVAFAANVGATDLAVDVEGRFLDRLLVSPIWRPAILVSRLTGSAVVGGFQATFIIVVFLAFGAEIDGGLPAMVVLVLVAMLLALFVGGLGCALALRTGTQEAVQGTFPLIFVSLFVSSAFFPTALMSGWYKAVAQANPITWIIDPTRRLLIEGWDTVDALQSLGVPLVASILAIALASRQLDKRIAAP
jgi:ABC-2 type transport system permease protein